jgi:hypothetical protein
MGLGPVSIFISDGGGIQAHERRGYQSGSENFRVWRTNIVRLYHEIAINTLAARFLPGSSGWRSLTPTTETTLGVRGSATATRTTTTGTTSCRSSASGVEAPFPDIFMGVE